MCPTLDFFIILAFIDKNLIKFCWHKFIEIFLICQSNRYQSIFCIKTWQNPSLNRTNIFCVTHGYLSHENWKFSMFFFYFREVELWLYLFLTNFLLFSNTQQLIDKQSGIKNFRAILEKFFFSTKGFSCCWLAFHVTLITLTETNSNHDLCDDGGLTIKWWILWKILQFLTLSSTSASKLLFLIKFKKFHSSRLLNWIFFINWKLFSSNSFESKKILN